LLLSDDPESALERIRRLPQQRLQSSDTRDIFAQLRVCQIPGRTVARGALSRLSPLDVSVVSELAEALAKAMMPLATLA